MNNNTLTPDEIKYQQALKRVKRIKGFYSHLVVYIVINVLLLIVNYKSSSEGWRWELFITPFFWGIGVLAHALSVFLPTILMGKDWEERKIKELMEKEKQNKWE